MRAKFKEEVNAAYSEVISEARIAKGLTGENLPLVQQLLKDPSIRRSSSATKTDDRYFIKSPNGGNLKIELVMRKGTPFFKFSEGGFGSSAVVNTEFTPEEMRSIVRICKAAWTRDSSTTALRRL